jgi:PKD repeat protein
MVKMHRLIGLLVLILILCVGFASANGTLTLNSPANVANGTTAVVTVTFNNDNTPPVNTLGFDLQFDNTVIEYVSAVSGTIGSPTVSNTGGASTPVPGTVRFGWYDTASDTSNITSGSSTLVQITFRAIKPTGGTSNLHFTNFAFADVDAGSITVTGTDGTFTVAALPKPTDTFTINPVSGNVRTGNTVTFTDVASGGTATSWNWSFGDGTSWYNTTVPANKNPPAHPYGSAGSFTASLMTSNAGGSTTTTTPINVYDLPTADFSANPSPVGTGATVTFTSATTGSSLTYAWNFGSGATPATSTAANPTCTYATTGSKTVSLTVSDPAGSITPVTHTVTVIAGPTAAFTPNVTAIRTNGYVLFTDGSSGSPQVWNWSFGDSSYLNSTATSNPVHQYTANGTYPVTLTVNKTVGASSASATINVYNQPLGDFTGTPTSVMTGQTVTFTGTTTGFTTGWSWDFGAGASPATSTNQNPTVTYSTAGPKTVVLTRSNPLESNSTTKVAYITVTVPSVPVPVITSDKTSGDVPLTVAFSSTTSDALVPTAYLWVFGEGNTSTVANPSFTFRTAGNYNVNLSITNASGTGTSALYSIVASERVAPPAPSPGATINGTTNAFGANLSVSGGNCTLSGGNILTMTNVTGFTQVIVTMSNVNTAGGNINGTITSVQYVLPDTTSVVNGITMHIQSTLNEANWTTNPFNLAITIPNPTTEDPVYSGNLTSGSTGYRSIATINITSADTITGGTLNMSVPVWWYNSYHGSPSSASTNYTAIMWTHAGTTTALYPTWGVADVFNQWFTFTPPGFSGGGIVGATSAAGGGGGGGGSSGGNNNGGGGGSSGSSPPATSLNSATFLQNSEGKVLQPYLVTTGNEASFFVPTGSKVLAKDGTVLNSVTVTTMKSTDVPAVPLGVSYTFAGYAVTGLPDGATFNPAATLTFKLTTAEWNTLLGQAQGNTGYLSIKVYDTTSSSWTNVPTTLDPTTMTVSASVSHFSIYGLFVDTSAATPIVTLTPVSTVTSITTRSVPTAAPTFSGTTPATTQKPTGAGIPWTLVIGAIVVIVVIAGVAYYYLPDIRKKHP